MVPGCCMPPVDQGLYWGAAQSMTWQVSEEGKAIARLIEVGQPPSELTTEDLGPVRGLAGWPADRSPSHYFHR